MMRCLFRLHRPCCPRCLPHCPLPLPPLTPTAAANQVQGTIPACLVEAPTMQVR